jgi:amino-acid N-acetyltransferase
MTVAIRRTTAGDGAPVVALVAAATLPVAGVPEAVAAADAWVAEDAGAIVGCVAVERFAGQALVRSLVVAADPRRAGIARRLLDAAVATVPPGVEVWALTETAEDYLVRYGFVAVDRTTATGPVTGSDEWARQCPAGAVALRLDRRDAATR